MLTSDVVERLSGLSAADLVQRLVDASARRGATLETQRCPAAAVAAALPLPRRSCAVLWDGKNAGATAPRTALVRGDTVCLTAAVPDAALSTLSLSADVRFRLARSRRRRLTGVLSSRAARPSPLLGRVEAVHFHWMDDCSPSVAYAAGAAPTLALQKRIAQWVVDGFSRNPLLRNIPVQTLLDVFPGLLALTPAEREALLKQAAELLGNGIVIWYGEAMIKQTQEGAAPLSLVLLTAREARCTAAFHFALATGHAIVGARRGDAAHALRYLFESYGATHLAASPALTAAALLTARATLPMGTQLSTDGGAFVRRAIEPYLFHLARVDDVTLQQFRADLGAAPVGRRAELARRTRETAAAALTAAATPAPRQQSAAQRTDARAEDDVTAFFAADQALRVDGDHLVAHAVIEVPPLLRVATATSETAAARAWLLEAAPECWQRQMVSELPADAPARDATELRLNVKAAAAALRQLPGTGDGAFLAVMSRARKRQRHVARVTPHDVRAALEAASIRLKRRAFLQLVDLLALRHDDDDRSAAARQYLEQQHVASSQIEEFSGYLSAASEAS